MASVARSREVLRIAGVSIASLKSERPMGDRWVILWAASLALLRAVGHALKNVDAEADEKVRAAVDHAWNEQLV